MTEPCDLTAVEARRLIGQKALSPVELTDSCIERIEAVDGSVNAMVTRCFERAQSEAKAAEAAVIQGNALGALHGLPMGVKDLNVTEGVLTTYGSPMHAENVPAKDERIIAALREAGAIVIGKTGKHFGPEEAEDYIGGFVIFNDITARDIQREEMRSGVFSFCKGIDSFCPLGPWIVTPDELGDPHDLNVELRVNGEPRQQSHSGNMSVTIPEMIAHYSSMGYTAGDVLSTGTVSGVAAFREDAELYYLKPGDVIECEIQNIGVLENPVISWEDAYGSPPPELT